MKCKFCGKEEEEKAIKLGWHLCKERQDSISKSVEKLKKDRRVKVISSYDPEGEKKAFENDILQPYTPEGKVNEKFVKVYGKKNLPKNNN